MKTITVIFIGLIAHINQPGSLDNTAVVIDAPDHTAPMIRISSDSMPATAGDDWLFQFPRPDELNAYEISLDRGMVIRLSGTRGLFCDHPQDVLDHLPRLRDLATNCGGLKESVRNRIPTADQFFAFFDYRGGRLRADNYLENQIEYAIPNGPTFTRCAACQMTYVADLDGNDALLTFKDASGTHAVRVPGGSKIELLNIPGQSSTNHFHEFYKLFEGCTGEIGDGAIVDDSLMRCTSKLRICNAGFHPFPFADCTNSQYP